MRNLGQRLTQLQILFPYVLTKHQALINALLFQCNWFVCIFAPLYFSFISATLLLIWHFNYLGRRAYEWRTMLIFSGLGYACDSLLANFSTLHFTDAIIITLPFTSLNLTLAPLWLLFLWLSFSSCLNHALFFLQTRLKLCAVLVIISIPLNYYVGAVLTGSEFLQSIPWILFLITLYWLVLLPLALHQLEKDRKSLKRQGGLLS